MGRSARLAGLLLAALAAAPAWGAPIAKATLHVEPAAIRPGQPFMAMVRLELPEHWHVYWRIPGDSGLAPKLIWKLPEGFSAGPIQWGAPKAIRVSSLTNYGF